MLSRKKVGLLNWVLASAWMLPAAGLSLVAAAMGPTAPSWLPGLCWIAAAIGLHGWGTDAARLAWEDEEAERERRAGKLCQAMEELPARLERLPREYEPRRPRKA